MPVPDGSRKGITNQCFHIVSSKGTKKYYNILHLSAGQPQWPDSRIELRLGIPPWLYNESTSFKVPKCHIVTRN